MEQVKNFAFQFAKSGAKPSGAVEAGITLTPTVNKFELNGLGSKLLKVQTGDYLAIVVDEDAIDINERYFLVKGSENDGFSAKIASHGKEQGVGKAQSFTFADVYPRILLDALQNVKGISVPVDASGRAVRVSKDRLRLMGLVEKGTCLKKVYAKLESFGEQALPNGETSEIFRLYDFMITDHSPKEVSKKSE